MNRTICKLLGMMLISMAITLFPQESLARICKLVSADGTDIRAAIEPNGRKVSMSLASGAYVVANYAKRDAFGKGWYYFVRTKIGDEYVDFGWVDKKFINCSTKNANSKPFLKSSSNLLAEFGDSCNNYNRSQKLFKSPGGKVNPKARSGKQFRISLRFLTQNGIIWGWVTGPYKGTIAGFGWIPMEGVVCDADLQADSPKGYNGECVLMKAGGTPTFSNPFGHQYRWLREYQILRVDNFMSGPFAQKFGRVSGWYRNQFQNWDWISLDNVDCSQEARKVGYQTADREYGESRYPIVFDGSIEMKPFGVHVTNYDRAETESPSLSEKCYYYGDGGTTLSLSKKMRKTFELQGFSFREMCTILRIENLRYHPETGERLPTFVVSDSQQLKSFPSEDHDFGAGVLSQELSFSIPKCFKSGKFQIDSSVGRVKTNCKFQYDPHSGRKLLPIETEQWGREDWNFWISGDAGPSGSIATRKLMVGAKRRNTKADLTEVAKAIAKRN